MAVLIQTIVFLTLVIFCNCDADSPTSFINPPEETLLITNVLTHNLDGEPVLPTLHVFKEDHGELVEEAVKDILPAEENNNAKSSMDITKVTSNEKNEDFNQFEGENAYKNQDFTVLRTNILSDITSHENKVNTPTANINAVKEVVDKTATDITLTVNSGISGELIKEDVVRESEAKPTLMATENVNTDRDINASTSTSTIHKESSTSKHPRHRAFQPTHKYSRPSTNKSSLKRYNRNHVTTTAKPVHFVPSKRYKARTYVKHTSNDHRSYYSQKSKIKSDSDTSETTESSIEETTQIIQHQTTRRYRQNHRFSPKKSPNQHTRPSAFSRGNTKLLEDHIATENVTDNIEMTVKPESNQEHSTSGRISRYRSPGHHFKPHSYQNHHPSSTEIPQHTKNVLLSSKEIIENDGTTTTTKAPITRYHRYTFNKHPLNLNYKLALTTPPTTTAPTELKDSDNKDIADVKPTMGTHGRFRFNQKRIFNKNTQTAKSHEQEETKSESNANQKEKSNDEDDKEVGAVTTPSVYQRFRKNRPRMNLMPKKEAPVKNLENHDDSSDTKSINKDNTDATTSIYQRFRTNRPRMNFRPKIEAQVKNLENHEDNSENEHTTTSIYHRFGTNRPRMNFKPKIKAQLKSVENHGDNSNNNQSNNINNESDGANEGATTSVYQRFRSNRPHMIIKPKIKEQVKTIQKSNTTNNGNDSLNKQTTSIYQRYGTNRPHMMMRPKTDIQLKHLENDEKASSNNSTNNENNIAVDEPTTTSIYQRFRQHSSHMHLKTLPIKSQSETSDEENTKSDEKDDSSTQVPTPKNIYQRYGQHTPHMHVKTQSSKSQNIDEDNMKPNDEDDSSTQIPTLKNIYQRHSPHMHVKTQISKSENLGEVNDENDSSTQVPTTTNIYQRFRQHRPHMHLKPQSSKSQSGNLGEVNLGSNDEEESSIEVPTPRNIYQRYGKHSPHMHLKTQSGNLGEVNMESNDNDDGDSSTEVPTTRNIYQRYGKHSPHMHLKPQSSKLQSGTLGEVNMESNDNDDGDSSTEVPTPRNLYQIYGKHSPHMHLKPQSSISQSGNLDEVNMESNDEDNSSAQIAALKNIYQRHSPHMHVKTKSSKSENFGEENIKSNVEDESSTEVPTTTNIYQRFRQPRPHMHIKPTEEKIVQYNENQDDLDPKSSDDVHGINEFDAVESREETHSSMIQNGNTYAHRKQGSRFDRRNQRHHHMNRKYLSDDLDDIYDDDDEDINDFNTHSSRKAHHNPSYRRRRPYDMRYRPSVQNYDSEEIDIEPENNRRVNRFQRRFASPSNLENSDLEPRSLSIEDFDENLRLLKRRSRENSSNRSLRSEGSSKVPKEATRSDQNTPEQSESLNLFSLAENSDESLFETYDPGEEYAFFDIQDDINSTESPFDKVTVTLPKSFIAEDKTNNTDIVLKFNDSKAETEVENNETTGLANAEELDHMQEYIDNRTGLSLHEPELVTVEPNRWFEIGTDENIKEKTKKHEEKDSNASEIFTVNPNHWFEVGTDEKTKEDHSNKLEVATVNPNQWFEVGTDEKTEKNKNENEETKKHEEENSNVKTETRNFNLSTATDSNPAVIKQEKKDKKNIDLEQEIKTKYNKNKTDNINKNHLKIDESSKETNTLNPNNIKIKEIETVKIDKNGNTSKEHINKDIIKNIQYDKITKTVHAANITSSINLKIPINNEITNTSKENTTMINHLDKDNKKETPVINNENSPQKFNISNETKVNKKITEDYKENKSKNSTINNSNTDKLSEFQHDNIKETVPVGKNVSHTIKDSQYDKIAQAIPAANITSSINTKMPINNKVANTKKENTTVINNLDKDNKTEKTMLNNENISQESNTSNEENLNKKITVDYKKPKSENSTIDNSNKEKLSELQYDKIKETIPVRNVSDNTNNSEKTIKTTTDSDLHKNNRTEEAMTINKAFSDESNEPKENNIQSKETQNAKKHNNINKTTENTNEQKLINQITEISIGLNGTDTTNEEHVKKYKDTEKNKLNSSNDSDRTEEAMTINEAFSDESNKPKETNFQSKETENDKKHNSKNTTIENTDEHKLNKQITKISSLTNETDTSNEKHVEKNIETEKNKINISTDSNINKSNKTEEAMTNSEESKKPNDTVNIKDTEDVKKHKIENNTIKFDKLKEIAPAVNLTDTNNKQIVKEIENVTGINTPITSSSIKDNKKIEASLSNLNLTGIIPNNHKEIKENKTKEIINENKMIGNKSTVTFNDDNKEAEADKIKSNSNEEIPKQNITVKAPKMDDSKNAKKTESNDENIQLPNENSFKDERFIIKNISTNNNTTENVQNDNKNTFSGETSTVSFEDNNSTITKIDTIEDLDEGDDSESVESNIFKIPPRSTPKTENADTTESNEENLSLYTKNIGITTENSTKDESYIIMNVSANNNTIKNVQNINNSMYSSEKSTVAFEEDNSTTTEVDTTEDLDEEDDSKSVESNIFKIPPRSTPKTENANTTKSNDENLSLNRENIESTNENSTKDESSIIKNESANNNTIENVQNDNENTFSGETSTVSVEDNNSTTTKIDTIEDFDDEDDSESVESNIFKIPPRSTPKTENADTTESNDESLSLNRENIELTNENSTKDESSIIKNVSTNNNTIENVQNINNNMYSGENSTVAFEEDNTITTEIDTIEDLNEEEDSKSNELNNINLDNNLTESTTKSEEYKSVESNIFKIPPRSTPETEIEIKDDIVNTNTSVVNKDESSIANNISTDNKTDKNDEMNEETTQNVNNLFIDMFETDDDGTIEPTKIDTTTQKMREEGKEDVFKPTETINEYEESDDNNSVESNIFKIPPRTTPKPEIEIKENGIAVSNWPVISGNILGKKTNVSVEIKIENNTIYIPSDVAIYEDLNNLNLYFNWSSSNEAEYRMSLNLTKKKSKYYEIDGVEMYRWKDGNVSVWVKNVTIQPKKDETADTALIIEVGNDVKVIFSNVEFLEVPDDNNEEIRSEASEAGMKLRMFHVEIAVGVLVVVCLLLVIVYIAVRKLRLRSLKENNKVPTS